MDPQRQFLVSIFPFVLIMNWLYYKTGRNILIVIVFHITAGYFNEIFATHPDQDYSNDHFAIFRGMDCVARKTVFSTEMTPMSSDNKFRWHSFFVTPGHPQTVALFHINTVISLNLKTN